MKTLSVCESHITMQLSEYVIDLFLLLKREIFCFVFNSVILFCPAVNGLFSFLKYLRWTFKPDRKYTATLILMIRQKMDRQRGKLLYTSMQLLYHYSNRCNQFITVRHQYGAYIFATNLTTPVLNCYTHELTVILLSKLL